MTSPVDICNQALDQIRATATVQSINPSDGTLAGDVCSRQYQARVDGVSRSAHWNCLRYEQPLTMIKAAVGTDVNPTGAFPAPIGHWLFEYLLPAAPYCLKVRYVYPWLGPTTTGGGDFNADFNSDFSISQSTPLTTGNIPFFPNSSADPSHPVRFVVSTDLDSNGNTIRVLYSNVENLICVYTARVTDPSMWDSSFTDAVVMTLAAWIAEPITGSSNITKTVAQMAGALVQAARLNDGNEGTLTTDATPDWIQIRGMGPSFGGFGFAQAPWDTITFPGGTAY